MKKIIFLTFFAFIVLLSSSPVFAESTATQSAQRPEKYGITFPIAGLGGCTDVASCKAYCNDASHRDACVSFAKQKGFYKQSEESKRKEQLITEAKTALGCTTAEACRAMCQDEANRDKCMAFAKKFGTPNINAEKTKNPEILEKAKQALGCASESSCKALCQDEANKDKCSIFAKSVGLQGGQRRVGPGGCASEDSCKEFCTANPDACKQYSNEMQKKRESMPSGYGSSMPKTGPGGCNSMETCATYCSLHLDECSDFVKANVDPKQMEQIKKVSGEYEKMCKEDPEKCKQIIRQGINGNLNGSENGKPDPKVGEQKMMEYKDQNVQQMQKREQEMQNRRQDRMQEKPDDDQHKQLPDSVQPQ